MNTFIPKILEWFFEIVVSLIFRTFQAFLFLLSLVKIDFLGVINQVGEKYLKKYFSIWLEKPFDFDMEALDEDEQGILQEGKEKHLQVLYLGTFFLPFFVMITTISSNLFTLLTACSFFTLFLGTAWYAISFQNVALAQLVHGVADRITYWMFSAFFLSLEFLNVIMIGFILKEASSFSLLGQTLPLWFGLPLAGIISLGVLIICVFIWKASVSYDAADSMLGDAFPQVMKAAHSNQLTPKLIEGLISAIDRLQSSLLNTQKQ